MKQETVFIVSGIALLLVFVISTLIYNTERAEQVPEAAPRNPALLSRFHSPGLGNPAAKVHIVEFFDPACETCAKFYPFVKNMMAANPDKIRLSVRYTPFHRGAEQVVMALEAARKQGRFWEALEALFGSQAQWVQHHTANVDLAWPVLARAGVDVGLAKKDMYSPEIARIIAQDLEDAKLLNVTKTPEYFVNGKPMPEFGYDPLKKLVQDALAEAYR